ncbi:MAG TPA: hypothetical protein VLA00_04145 [Xanthobacteraceae bacterium]|nr:hypothetical protein [Xanthobacteraceae bacterium]
MIETIMFFAIGFLAATLAALAILPAVWRRAVRLTTRRIEGAIPVSMAEIQADKDQLRAGFAVAARKLELAVDHVRQRDGSLRAELGAASAALAVTASDAEAKAARIAELEAQQSATAERLALMEADLENRTAALDDVQQRLTRTEAELAAEAERLDERSSLAAGFQVENVALSTRIVELEQQLRVAGVRLTEAEGRHAERRSDEERTAGALTALRAQAESANGRAPDPADSAADAELRARIGDVAAEMVRITAVLEGPSSPIPGLIAGAPDGNGALPSLAERVRHLQQHAAAR